MRSGDNEHYVYQEMPDRRVDSKELVYKEKGKYSITGKDK